MAEILAEMNYEFDSSNIDNLDETIDSNINEETYIHETPEKIKTIFQDYINKLKDNLEDNLENLAEKFKDYWNDQADQLRRDVEENLALDSDTLYDIHVKNAKKADDSLKLEGKKLNDIYTHVVTSIIPTSTSGNSLKLEEKSLDDIKNDIKNNVIVNESLNASKLDNKTYTEVKNDILSEVETSSGGVSLETVKSKVENEWTAKSSKNSIKFNNLEAAEWENKIKETKVNNSGVADKIKKGDTSVDYDYIIETSKAITEDTVSSRISNENSDFVNTIKNIKVKECNKADNANKISNKTIDDIKNDIKENIKVDKATQADRIGDMDIDGIQNYTDDKISTIKNDLLTGNLVPKKADNLSQLVVEDCNIIDNDNTYTLRRYIENVSGEINDVEHADTADDAEKLGGKTLDDIKNDIKENVKVNAATQADYANEANEAQIASGLTTKLTNEFYMNIIEIDNILENRYANGITRPTRNTILNALPFYADKVDDDGNIVINNMNLFPIIEDEVSFKKITYEYEDGDSDNRILKINHYSFFEDGDDEGTDIVYIKSFDYDDDNNKVTITKTAYVVILQADLDENNNITEKYQNKYKIKQTITETYNDDNQIISKEFGDISIEEQ